MHFSRLAYVAAMMALNIAAIKGMNIRHHSGGARYVKRRRWRHGRFKR